MFGFKHGLWMRSGSIDAVVLPVGGRRNVLRFESVHDRLRIVVMLSYSVRWFSSS